MSSNAPMEVTAGASNSTPSLVQQMESKVGRAGCGVRWGAAAGVHWAFACIAAAHARALWAVLLASDMHEAPPLPCFLACLLPVLSMISWHQALCESPASTTALLPATLNMRSSCKEQRLWPRLWVDPHTSQQQPRVDMPH